MNSYKTFIIILIIILFIYLNFIENSREKYINNKITKDVNYNSYINLHQSSYQNQIQTKLPKYNYKNSAVKYNRKSKLQNLKEKSKDRRLKIKRFQENKTSFYKKHEAIENFQQNIFYRNREKKYLIQKNSIYRDPKYRDYLAHQKEKVFRINMIEKLIKKRE